MHLNQVHYSLHLFKCNFFRDIFIVCQPLRIFNTWMGDQSKLLLLKEVIKVIQEEGLLQRVQEAGQVLLSGLENVQVIPVPSCDGLVSK